MKSSAQLVHYPHLLWSIQREILLTAGFQLGLASLQFRSRCLQLLETQINRRTDISSANAIKAPIVK